MLIIDDHCPLQEPQCKVCRQTPFIRSSKHLFLDLPKVCFTHCVVMVLVVHFTFLTLLFGNREVKASGVISQLVEGSYPCGNFITKTALLFLEVWLRVKSFSSAFSFSLFLSCSLRLSWSSGWTSQPAQETGQQMPNRSLAPG